MAELKLTELEGWDDVIALAGQDNVPGQGRARTEASKRQTFAIANLSKDVFNAQKHISQRLDTLNQKLDEATAQSSKSAKGVFLLTIFLVVATIVQAIAAIIVATKANG